MKQLETVREVNEVLGVQVVADLTGREPTTVYKCQAENSYPASWYRIITEALAKLDCEAPLRLFRFMESASPDQPEEETADA